jgi:hypothetical protein
LKQLKNYQTKWIIYNNKLTNLKINNMATPSGLITLNDIWIEPNPSWTTSESFSAITYNSWAEGPLGANTYAWNGWGNDGGTAGADVIYNAGGYLQQGVDPINFAGYSNKQYYFDPANLIDITFEYNNTVSNPPPVPPAPPIENSVIVDVACYDSTGTYTVHQGFTINANASSQQGVAQIPGGVTNSPLVENVYWAITVTTVPGNTLSNIAFKVNGTTVINVGYGGGSFDWNSSGASQGYTSSGGINYDVYIT